MKTSILSVILGLVLAAGIGTSVYVKKNAPSLPQEVTTTPSAEVNTSTPSQTPTVRTYRDDDDDDVVVPAPTPAPSTAKTGISMTTVAQHNSRSSCWSAINGSVYDLTSWIPNHPGGEQAILSLCGRDGSSAFNNQHGGQSKPTAILAGFKIGVLQ